MRPRIDTLITCLSFITEGILNPLVIFNSINVVVISGGGTMNREAACLGVPVYNIYAGPLGSEDRYLMEIGKLKLVKGIEIN